MGVAPERPARREHLSAHRRVVRDVSLLSIGGGNAVLPEMHLQAVKGITG